MKIIIPGDPEAQPRMRYFSRGGMARCYDPAKQEKDRLKAFLQDFLSRNYSSYEFPRNPRVSFFFYCKIPSTMPKALRWHAERGLLRKRTRPDGDNYIKLYFDCMNEILFEDDSQAIIGCAEKFFHKEPKTVMYLDDTSDILNIPLDDEGRYIESYEWIHAKMASHSDYGFLPYEGIPIFDAV